MPAIPETPLAIRTFRALLDGLIPPEKPVHPDIEEGIIEFSTQENPTTSELAPEIVAKLEEWERLRRANPDRTDIPSDQECRSIAFLTIKGQPRMLGVLSKDSTTVPYTQDEIILGAKHARGLQILAEDIARAAAEASGATNPNESFAEAMANLSQTIGNEIKQALVMPSGGGEGSHAMMYSPDYVVTFSKAVVEGYEDMQKMWFRRIGTKLVPPGCQVNFDDPIARQKMIDFAFGMACSVDQNLMRYVIQRNQGRTVQFQTLLGEVIPATQGLKQVFKQTMAVEEGDAHDVLTRGFNALFVEGAPIEAAIGLSYPIPLRLRNGEVAVYWHSSAEYMDWLRGNITKLKSRDVQTYAFKQAREVNIGDLTIDEIKGINSGNIMPIAGRPGVYMVRGVERDLSMIAKVDLLRIEKEEAKQVRGAVGRYRIITSEERSLNDLTTANLEQIAFGQVTLEADGRWRFPDGSVKYIDNISNNYNELIQQRRRIDNFDTLMTGLSSDEQVFIMTDDRAWQTSPGSLTFFDDAGNRLRTIALPSGLNRAYFDQIRVNRQDMLDNIHSNLKREPITLLTLNRRIDNFDTLMAGLSLDEQAFIMTDDRAWQTTPGSLVIFDDAGNQLRTINLPGGIDREWFNDIRVNRDRLLRMVDRQFKEVEPKEELLLDVEGIGQVYMSQLSPQTRRQITDGELGWKYIFEEEFDPAKPRRIREGERFYTLWGWAKTDKGWGISALPLLTHKLHEMGIQEEDILTIADLGPNFEDMDNLGMYDVVTRVKELVDRGIDFENYDEISDAEQLVVKEYVGALRDATGHELNTHGRPWQDHKGQQKAYIMDGLNREVITQIQEIVYKGIDLNSAQGRAEMGKTLLSIKALQQAIPFSVAEAWMGITHENFPLASWFGQDHISEYNVKANQLEMYQMYYGLGIDPMRDGVRGYYSLLEAAKRKKLDPIMIGCGKNEEQAEALWLDPTGHKTPIIQPIRFSGNEAQNIQAKRIIEALGYHQEQLRHNVIGMEYDAFEKLMLDADKVGNRDLVIAYARQLLGYHLQQQITNPESASAEYIWLNTNDVLIQMNNLEPYQGLDFKRALGVVDCSNFLRTTGVRVTDDYTKGALAVGAAYYHLNSYKTRLYPGVPKGFKWPNKYLEATFQQMKAMSKLQIATTNALHSRTIQMTGVQVKDLFSPDSLGEGLGQFFAGETLEWLEERLDRRGAQSPDEAREYYKSTTEAIGAVFASFNMYGDEGRKQKVSTLAQYLMWADDEISRKWIYKTGDGEEGSQRELVEVDPRLYPELIEAFRISRLGVINFPMGSDYRDFASLSAEEQAMIGSRRPFATSYRGVPFYLSNGFAGRAEVGKKHYGHRGLPIDLLKALKETLIDGQVMTIEDFANAIKIWQQMSKKQKGATVINHKPNLTS